MSGRRRDSYARNTFAGRRERGEKRERKIADGVAEFGPVGSVPGIDGVEGFELRDARVLDHAKQVQASIGKSPGAVGEADQWKQRPWSPNFGVTSTGSFERGERKNDVADRSRAYEKSAMTGDPLTAKQDRLSHR